MDTEGFEPYLPDCKSSALPIELPALNDEFYNKYKTHQSSMLIIIESFLCLLIRRLSQKPYTSQVNGSLTLQIHANVDFNVLSDKRLRWDSNPQSPDRQSGGLNHFPTEA